MHTSKAIADGPVGQVLTQGIKQVINKSTRVILDFFSLLYYDTADRKRIWWGGK